MTQLSERLCFNLSDTLTGYVEFLSDLLERALSAVIETETKADDLLLTVGKRLKHFI